MFNWYDRLPITKQLRIATAFSVFAISLNLAFLYLTYLVTVALWGETSGIIAVGFVYIVAAAVGASLSNIIKLVSHIIHMRRDYKLKLDLEVAYGRKIQR